MSNEVSTLSSNLTSLAGAFLGISYSELKHKYEIEKNFIKGGSKKFGVIPRDINEVAGTTCFITLDQDFELLVSDTYKTIVTDDSSKDSVIKSIQDLCLDLYSDIISKKANTPSIVMNIRNFTSSIEELDEHKLIINRINFTIQYRKSRL